MLARSRLPDTRAFRGKGLRGSPLLAALALAASVACTSGAAAEPAGVHATLRTWADDTWLKILDRDGARDGRLSRRGILQRFNVTTDDEYWLDLVSKSFPLDDDYRWHHLDRGLRFAAGSVNPRELAETLDFKVRVPLTETWAFDGRFTEAKGPDLDRDLFRATFERTLGRGAFASMSGTMGSVKPSTDLEAGGGWRSEDGRTEIFTGVAILDAFNDIVYVDIGVHPNHADTALVLDRQPWTWRIAAEVAVGPNLRVEAYGAVMRDAVVRAFAQRSPLEGFRQHEEFGFAGGLAEWAFSPDVAVGLWATTIDAGIVRSPLEEGTVEHDFTLDESESSIAGFVIVRPHPRWRLESWMAREWRKELRGVNPDAMLTPVDYADETWRGTVKALYAAESGFQSVIAVDMDLRDNVRGESEVPTTFDSLGNHNVRFRIDVGWRITDRAELYLGAGYDLDGDNHSDPELFDGGRTRFVVHF